MPPPIPVNLVPYNPEWPQLAASHVERLRVLGSTLVIVHHIGSTSVPGLAAKPIIDLMPLVTTLTDLDRERGRIEALGYEWHGEYGIPGRRYCTLATENGIRAVQLHIFENNSPHAERHIALRDYLRAHPAVAAAYETESAVPATSTQTILTPTPTRSPPGSARPKPPLSSGSSETDRKSQSFAMTPAPASEPALTYWLKKKK